MKRLTALAGVLLSAALAQAADDSPFGKLQPLVGTWEATVNGKKVRTVITSAANGSVLIENMLPESENMYNAIFASGGKLMMTHYCAGGSQPRYRAARFDGKSADFRFFDGTNLGKEYMSGVKVTVVDNDHFTEVWRTTKDGKETADLTFEYTRVK